MLPICLRAKAEQERLHKIYSPSWEANIYYRNSL